MKKKEIKIAIIDLYNNEVNEGIRCINEIVSDAVKKNNTAKISSRRFETRYKDEVPDSSYDIFISSGGPGSPFDGVNQKWDADYFKMLDEIWNYNQHEKENKKYIFFICHSFQMMARFFKFADVTERYEKSFGVLPFVRTNEGKKDFILSGLVDPFYAADFRQFQVVQPDKKIIDELGAKILSTEIDDHVHESAVMAVRISDEIAGTQFHPEADPSSMLFHLKQEERKKHVVEKFGEAKYHQIISLLEEPDKIKLTRETVLPAFLNSAIEKLNFIRT